MGDTLTAQCITPLSFPPSVLRWYINHDSADRAVVTNQSVVELRSPLKSDSINDELETDTVRDIAEATGIGTGRFSVVGLNLIVRDKLARHSGGYEREERDSQ